MAAFVRTLTLKVKVGDNTLSSFYGIRILIVNKMKLYILYDNGMQHKRYGQGYQNLS